MSGRTLLYSRSIDECSSATEPGPEQADPVKIVIDSTADWGQIMFDDLNSTNTKRLGS